MQLNSQNKLLITIKIHIIFNNCANEIILSSEDLIQYGLSKTIDNKSNEDETRSHQFLALISFEILKNCEPYDNI